MPFPYSLLVVSFLIPQTHAAPLPPEEPAPNYCQSTREFITTIEYLRSETDLAANEANARSVATAVSAGCTGAANRFVRVIRLLGQAGLSQMETLKIAVAISRQSDGQAALFATIFRHALAADALDLDVAAAVKMAQQLVKATALLNDPSDKLRLKLDQDFAAAVKYCLDKNGLGLNKRQCADLAEQLTALGAQFSWTSFGDFKSLHEYLSSTEGVNLATDRRLELVRFVLRFGPGAIENFRSGLNYARARSGLNLPDASAIEFAKKMAQNTVAPKSSNMPHMSETGVPNHASPP